MRTQQLREEQSSSAPVPESRPRSPARTSGGASGAVNPAPGADGGVGVRSWKRWDCGAAPIPRHEGAERGWQRPRQARSFQIPAMNSIGKKVRSASVFAGRGAAGGELAGGRAQGHKVCEAGEGGRQGPGEVRVASEVPEEGWPLLQLGRSAFHLPDLARRLHE